MHEGIKNSGTVFRNPGKSYHQGLNYSSLLFSTYHAPNAGSQSSSDKRADDEYP